MLACIRRFALIMLLVYASLCAVLWFNQCSLLYLPQFTRVAVEEADYALRRGDIVLRGWVVSPGRPQALLYFGGNGESIEHNREDFERWFPQHTIYLVAYRGYGASDGEPGEQLMLNDALALYDAVADSHADVSVIGRSLGSAVAMHVATQREVARLVLVTPFDSVLAVAQAAYPWMPVGLLLQDRFDSLARAPQVTAPTLVLSAGRDSVVPSQRTTALIDAFATPPKHVRVPPAGHDDIHAFGDYEAALSEFLTNSDR